MTITLGYLQDCLMPRLCPDPVHPDPLLSVKCTQRLLERVDGWIDGKRESNRERFKTECPSVRSPDQRLIEGRWHRVG